MFASRGLTNLLKSFPFLVFWLHEIMQRNKQKIIKIIFQIYNKMNISFVSQAYLQYLIYN